MKWSNVLPRFSAFATLCVLCGFGISSQSLAAAVTWPEYWKRVESSSPAVKGLKTQADQIRSQVALPIAPPMFTVGSMGVNGPLSQVMEQTYEISQKVPFPTRFGVSGSLKDQRVREKELEVQTALLDLKQSLHGSFIELTEVAASRDLIREKQNFFTGHLKRLRAYSISDQVQQLHILEMEAEVKSLSGEIAQLDAQEKSIRLKLGSYLGERGTPFAEEPQLESIQLSSASPRADLEKGSRLKMIRSKEELAVQEQSVAKTGWLPDLSLTYRRRVRKDNVMDSSHEVMIGVELPFLFGWQASARSKEASLKATEVQFESVQQHRALGAELEAIQARLVALQEQLKLMRNDILPNLEKRLHLLHRLAQTDTESLDLHRSTYDQVVTGRLKNLKLESEYRKELLALETLTGSIE